MFAQILYVQWKWNRDFLAFFVALAFVAPLLMVRIASQDPGVLSARELVFVGGVVGGSALTLALLSGTTLAWQAYGIDDRAGHIYALSLPVTRQRALTLRAVTASILLALPAAALWLGAMLAASQLTFAGAVRAYPGSLALRTLLAAWVTHAAVFALRYSAGRRARHVLLGLTLTAMAAGFIMLLAPGTQPWIRRAGDFLISNPGPFGVLFGRWTLIDV